MKLTLTKKTAIVLLLALTNLHVAHASEDNVIKSFFPATISSIKDSDGNALTFENGLSYKSIEVKLDGIKGPTYSVVIYRAAPSMGEFICELAVINNTTKPAKLMLPSQLARKGSLLSCTEIKTVDLDGDGKPEILIESAGPKGEDNPPTIFKWTGAKLVEITPQMTLNGVSVSALRSVLFVDRPTGTIMIDAPDSSISQDESTKTYAFNKGKLVLGQTYDYFSQFIKAKNQIPRTISTDLTLKPGTYTLEASAFNKDRRAIRAEVLLDNSVVLRPQDFCSGPQPSKSDKAAWTGNDDLDDKDEDHMKRCPPKDDVYAIVKVNKDSVLKIKVYGAGGSQLQVTLKKK